MKKTKSTLWKSLSLEFGAIGMKMKTNKFAIFNGLHALEIKVLFRSGSP